MDRREFLQTVGGVAVAGTMGAATIAAAGQQPGTAPVKRPRVAVLWEPGLAAADVERPDESGLRAALADCDAAWLPAVDLTAQLSRDRFDLLLMTAGSAFPKPAWPAIYAFLKSGGNLVNLGGAPFAVPAVLEDGRWRHEARQTTFHRLLGITQAYPIDIAPGDQLRMASPHAWTAALLLDWRASGPARAWALSVRLTSSKLFPDEDGSEGPREAILDGLIHVNRPAAADDPHAGYPYAAPAVLIDRMAGEFAGGRWVFATSDRQPGASAIRDLVRAAAMGCQRLQLRSTRRVIEPGQPLSIVVSYVRPGVPAASPFRADFLVSVRSGSGELVPQVTKVTLAGEGPVIDATLSVPVAMPGTPVRIMAGVSPIGSEQAGANLLMTSAADHCWVRGADDLSFGSPLGTTGTTLTRNDQPFVAAGTTFMPAHAQRRFLVEPSGAISNGLGSIRAQGGNIVRTGIWTGWSLHADPSGQPTPAVLEALDAYLLSAIHEYGLAVVFTFFAFLPHAWGGTNPYFDPKAIEAQRTFITLIVRRYRGVKSLIWDLINEPSFSSAAQLWTTRPNFDAFEQRAWEAWLAARYPAPTRDAHLLRLQEIWRCAPGEELVLPPVADFTDTNLLGGRKPLKALDYRLFAQEMFRRWTQTMAAAIKEAGGSEALVTVGQDEGGVVERPSNHLFGDAVDLTSIHTWWFNDDQLWDIVTSTLPTRPNLVQETGVMHYETADGRAWRTEDQVRDLLERKLALAVGVGGAGFIQWAWHTNPYLPSDNEAAIGLMRVDGSFKPEFAAWRGMARFAVQAAPHMSGRVRNDVLLVIPHANQFSVRSQAVEATRRAVRTMHHDCRVAMSAASEFGLDAWPGTPKLVVLPSPRILSGAAWTRLMVWVEQGTTLAVTGPFDDDEHWLPSGRMASLGLSPAVRPVMPEETVFVDGVRHDIRYRGEKMQRVEAAVTTGEPAVRLLTHGRGRVVWSPLPLEMSDESAATAALYRFALRTAGVTPVCTTDAPSSVLVYAARFARHTLYTIVSETSGDLEVQVTDTETGTTHHARVAGGRAALILIDRQTGAEEARYPPRH